MTIRMAAVVYPLSTRRVKAKSPATGPDRPGFAPVMFRTTEGDAGGTPVGEHHHQTAPRPVTRLFAHHNIACGQQALRQWCFPAGVEPGQPATSDVHRRCWRQQQLGVLLPERDHGHLVAALVRVSQQRQRGTADRRHPVARGHRPRGVDHEDHQIAFAAFPDRPTHVVRLGIRPARAALATGRGEQRPEHVYAVACPRFGGRRDRLSSAVACA